MPTPNEISADLESSNNGGNGFSVGEHVLQEGYKMGGLDGKDRTTKMLEIIEANTKLVMQCSERLCDYYSNSLMTKLPENFHADFIDSLSVFTDKNDVVYKGMVQRYDARKQSDMIT